MKIFITVDTNDSDKKQYLELSNEDYNNLNFIDFTVGGKTYGVVVEELLQAMEVFARLRDHGEK